MEFWSGHSQDESLPKILRKQPSLALMIYGEWLVVPQAIATEPAWFMRVVSRLLAGRVEAGCCVVFISGILISSNSEQDHDRHVRVVLDILRRKY